MRGGDQGSPGAALTVGEVDRQWRGGGLRMREERHDGVQDREAAEIKGEHSRAKD